MRCAHLLRCATTSATGAVAAAARAHAQLARLGDLASAAPPASHTSTSTQHSSCACGDCTGTSSGFIHQLGVYGCHVLTHRTEKL